MRSRVKLTLTAFQQLVAVDNFFESAEKRHQLSTYICEKIALKTQETVKNLSSQMINTASIRNFYKLMMLA